MAATKQFLLNYDSNILLPYTTLDCILGDENADLEKAGNTGIDVITDRLLKNIKQFIYRNTATLEDPDKLDSKKIGDASAFILGISSLREGGAQLYTKFHQLTLDSPGHAGQYLGADGANHEVKFDSSFTASDSWYSTAIEVKPSFNLDNPIDASISMAIKTSTDCFEITGGALYSKYSTRSTLSNVTKLAQYTLNKIVKADNKNWDASTGEYTSPESFGTNFPVQLNNGVLSPIKTTNGIGNNLKPIYIDASGEIKESMGDMGNNFRPIYMAGGKFLACAPADVGGSSQPMYYNSSTGFTACTDDAGAEDTLGYIDGGVFKTSTKSIGGTNQIMYLSNGVFTPSNGEAGDKEQPIYLDDGVFKSITATLGENLKKPMYMQGGVFKEFTKRVSLIDEAPIGSNNEASIGATAQPVYVDSNGVIKKITATICSESSNSLLALSGGIFKKQSANAGTSIKPVYVSDGTILASDASVGNETTPVYLSGGTITECKLRPSSISGAEATDGGTLYLQSVNGVKQWAGGNRTTAGTFENVSTTAYYLVGINAADPSCYGDGSFKLLNGAKRSDGTGIYFKNYELFQTSDEKLKTFTDEIDINFDNLATIKKGIYHWTDDPNKISDIGIGARSLEALYPEIVDENEGVKTVAYNRLGVIALAAIDKLHLRVKELETEMKELKAEIRALKQGK